MENLQETKAKSRKTAIETAKSWGGKPIYTFPALITGYLFAIFAYRKPIATIHPGHLCLCPACSTFPGDPNDLPTITPVLHVPQSARLQGGQRRYNSSLQRPLPCPGWKEAKPIHEQVWRKGYHTGCNHEFVSGKCCGWRIELFVRVKEERG